jgi:hypothetical protein
VKPVRRDEVDNYLGVAAQWVLLEQVLIPAG